jgi:transposase
VSAQSAPVTSSTIVVAVDVGKTSALFSVTDTARCRLVAPSEFTMNRSGLSAAAARAMAVVPPSGRVKVGVEAAGHYHRPVLDHRWPPGWEVLELNPAHVAEQRRVQGRRRVKTDVIDLEAITELVLAGHGRPVTDRDVVIGELSAWAAHRSRRVSTRTATKNQLLGQLDRAFPGLTLALPDVLGTKIGRLVAAEFSDPARLAALGVNRLIRFAAARELQLRRPVAERLVAAAREALPTRDAVIARQILAADLDLLADLDDQISSAEMALAVLLPRSPYATLTSVPGWAVVRVSNYAAGPRGSAAVARIATDLPCFGAFPDAVRIGSQTPRRRHQPRRQRGPASRIDRPRHRAVADRAGGQDLRARAQGARQARRHHRLRLG